MTESPDEKAATSERGGKRARNLLLIHSAVVGLTPLIPVPLVDDAVKRHVERRLTLEIGKQHGVAFSDEMVDHLGGEVDGNLLKAIAVGIATFPLKLIFRKAFVVLEVKRASDEASRCFHRGHLLEYALLQRLLPPQGRRSHKEVARAIDGACKQMQISPMGVAMREAFEGSKGLLASAGRSFLDRLQGGPAKRSDGERIGSAVEDATKEEGVFSPIAERMRRAVSTLPEEHFRELERRFDDLLV